MDSTHGCRTHGRRKVANRSSTGHGSILLDDSFFIVVYMHVLYNTVIKNKRKLGRKTVIGFHQQFNPTFVRTVSS